MTVTSKILRLAAVTSVAALALTACTNTASPEPTPIADRKPL